MNKEYVDKLKNNKYFMEFCDDIFKEINIFSSVDGLENLSNKLAGEEAKVRLRTKKKLLDLFSIFLFDDEKKKVTEEQLEEAKNKFRL